MRSPRGLSKLLVERDRRHPALAPLACLRNGRRSIQVASWHSPAAPRRSEPVRTSRQDRHAPGTDTTTGSDSGNLPSMLSTLEIRHDVVFGVNWRLWCDPVSGAEHGFSRSSDRIRPAQQVVTDIDGELITAVFAHQRDRDYGCTALLRSDARRMGYIASQPPEIMVSLGDTLLSNHP